jgi:hypothetical protein
VPPRPLWQPLLSRATGASGIGEGVLLGLVTGVGIAGAVLFVTGYFNPKRGVVETAEA